MDYTPGTMQTFQLFQKLPIELRNQIWTLSLPGPRRVAPYPHRDPSRISDIDNEDEDEDEDEEASSHSQSYELAALHVNRESRSVTLKFYSTWSNTSKFGLQYVDFSIDSVYLEYEKLNKRGRPNFQPQFTEWDLVRIKRLDLGFGDSIDKFAAQLCDWMDTWLVAHFGELKEFNALLEIESEDGSDCEIDRFHSTGPISKKMIETRLETARNEGLETLNAIAEKTAKKGVVWSIPSFTVSAVEV